MKETRRQFLASSVLGAVCGLFGCNNKSRRVAMAADPKLPIEPQESCCLSNSHPEVFRLWESKPPGAEAYTPAGVRVWVPDWFKHWQNWKAEVFRLIDTAPPDYVGNYNIPPDATYSPQFAGGMVVLWDPGDFSYEPSPTGLAGGIYDAVNDLLFIQTHRDKFEAVLRHEKAHRESFLGGFQDWAEVGHTLL